MAGVSRDDRPVACRAISPPPETEQARAQCDLAHLCGEEVGRHRRRSERRSHSRPRGVLERTPAWPATGSTMGQGMEPGADRPALADRLSGRRDDAHQPRSHLSGTLHPRPRRVAPGTNGLLANRAGVAGAEGPHTSARQRLRLAGDHDQPASCRGSRPGSARALGRRPHPGPWQLGDRHPGRAHDALYDAAASSPSCGPRRFRSRGEPSRPMVTNEGRSSRALRAASQAHRIRRR